MPKAGWHSGHKESGHKESRSPSPMGGGLRAPLPTWVSHTKASQGNQAVGDSHSALPSNHPQARITQSLFPHGTCGF